MIIAIIKEALTKEGKGVRKLEVLDLNHPLQLNGATSEDVLGMLVGILDDKTNQEMHDKPPMENEIEANNGEPSGSHSLSLTSFLFNDQTLKTQEEREYQLHDRSLQMLCFSWQVASQKFSF